MIHFSFVCTGCRPHSRCHRPRSSPSGAGHRAGLRSTYPGQRHLKDNILLLVFFKKKWANLGPFFVYFRSFQTNITSFTTNICEKMSIHAGIRTHDLRNVSLFPSPLDQGFRPIIIVCIVSSLTDLKGQSGMLMGGIVTHLCWVQP